MRSRHFILGLAAFGLATPATAEPASAEPTTAERAQLEAMLEAAFAIDPRADEPAYVAAFTEALAYASRYYPAGHPELAVIEFELAIADFNTGRFAPGIARLTPLIPLLEAGGEQYVPQLLTAMNALLVAYVRTGELGEARAIGDAVLDARRKLIAAEPDNQAYIAGLAASLNNSGFILNMDGNPQAAIAHMNEVEALIDSLTNPTPELLSYLGNTPTYWAETGNSDMALSEGRRLTAKLETLLPPNHPILANSYNSLAVRAAERGQLDDAERFSRRAIELALNAATPDMAMASSMQLGLAQTLIKLGDPAAALAVVDEALVHLLAGYGERGELTLYAQHVRTYALRDLGRIDEAIAVTQAADLLRQETMEPANSRRISGQETLAELYLEAGRPQDAYLTQSGAQEARETGDSVAVWEKLTGDVRLGAYAIRAGHGTMAPVVAAHQQLNARRDAIAASGEPDAVQLEILSEAHVWAMDAAMHAGDFDLAFAFAQDALSTKADRAAQMAAFRRGLTTADAAAVREYQDQAEALRTLSARQLEDMSRGVTPDAMRAMNDEIAAARAQLASAGRAIDSAAFAAAAPVDLATAQAALADGEALMLAHPMPLGLGVLVATRTETAMQIAPLKSTQVAAFATGMRSALTGGDVLMRGVLVTRPEQGAQSTSSAPSPEYDFAPGAALHQALFEGAAGDLLSRSGHISIAAGGALSRIPFSALAPQASNLQDADWVIRHHSLSTVATLSALGQAQMASAGHSARVVAVGAPVLQGTGLSTLRSSRGLSVTTTVADLPPLPEALAELNAISRVLNSSDSVLLVGEDAREARVLEEISRPAGVIAFATHGLLEGEVAGLLEPALVLTPNDTEDGLLTASEVAALTMDADWVILSACNTGGPDRPGAAGLSGLASAFLYAGARNLLVSHWEVADDVARALTVPTVESYYRDGVQPAEGLRQATLALIDNSDDPRLSHPAYWGPFVYVGGS